MKLKNFPLYLCLMMLGLTGCNSPTQPEDDWEKTSCPGGVISCLAISSDGYVFAGTDSGIYYSADGEDWERIDRFPPRKLAVSATGIFATNNITDRLFQRRRDNSLWTSTLLDHYCFCLAISSDGYVFAGTEDGVYYSSDEGQSWEQVGSSINEVQCLAISPSGWIFASIGYGVKTYKDGSNHYNGLYSVNVRCLAVSSGMVFAGADNGPHTPEDNGIYGSSDNGQSWVQSGLKKTHIQSLVASSGQVFAGAVKGGIYYSADNGKDWKKISELMANCFAIGPDGRIFVGTEEGVFFSDNY